MWPETELVRVLLAVVLSTLQWFCQVAVARGGEWWSELAPERCTAAWEARMHDEPERGAAELADLLDAATARPSSYASVCWLHLRSSSGFEECLSSALAASRTDRLARALAPRAEDCTPTLVRIVRARDPARARVGAAIALGSGAAGAPALLELASSPHEPLEVRLVAARALAAGPAPAPAERARLQDAAATAASPELQAALFAIVARAPTVASLHALVSAAANARSDDVCAALLEAFGEACRRAAAARDRALIDEAVRGLDVLRATRASPVMDGGSLCALRWIRPAEFEQRMAELVNGTAAWQVCSVSEPARRGWMQAVWLHGELVGTSEVDLAARWIDRLATEDVLAPGTLDLVLAQWTDAHPRWVLQCCTAPLRAGSAEARRRAAELVASLPEPLDDSRLWDGCAAPAEPFAALCDRRISVALAQGLLYRGLRACDEWRRVCEVALADCQGDPTLVLPLLSARAPTLRELARREALRLEQPALLQALGASGERYWRRAALGARVRNGDVDAALELAHWLPHVLLDELCAPPRSDHTPAPHALAELGCSWLDADPRPPRQALAALLDSSTANDERWTALWSELLSQRRRSATRATVRERLLLLCAEPDSPALAQALERLSRCGDATVAGTARERLAGAR